MQNFLTMFFQEASKKKNFLAIMDAIEDTVDEVCECRPDLRAEATQFITTAKVALESYAVQLTLKKGGKFNAINV